MASGAEISLGGHRWRDQLHEKVDPKVEDEQINRSIDILQEVTGDKTLPKGTSFPRRFLLLQYIRRA